MSARLASPVVDTDGSESLDILAGTRRSFKDIASPYDLEVLEAGGHDRGLELCFQQSTGYSVGPQVDVAFRSFRDRLAHQDVTNLKPATRTQRPVCLGERNRLVR